METHIIISTITWSYGQCRIRRAPSRVQYETYSFYLLSGSQSTARSPVSGWGACNTPLSAVNVSLCRCSSYSRPSSLLALLVVLPSQPACRFTLSKVQFGTDAHPAPTHPPTPTPCFSLPNLCVSSLGVLVYCLPYATINCRFLIIWRAANVHHTSIYKDIYILSTCLPACLPGSPIVIVTTILRS